MDDRFPQHATLADVSGKSIARNNLAPLSSSPSLPAAFARIVQAVPEKIAVIQGNTRWSYADLGRLSDVTAAALTSKGVKRGDCVGLFMDRSTAALIAMLAILKVGAAYVPFDPAAPAQRLSAQAEAAGIKVLAIAEGTAAPAWFTGELEKIDASSSARVDARPLMALHPLELAYVIYTSGSTNEAKGVCIPHRAVLDLVVGADYCRFVASDVVYHGMSVAFDGSTFEIWGALLTGATLVIAAPRISVKEIADLVEKHGITVLLLSTGVFNAFGREGLQRLASVRVLLAGGDVMSPDAASQFLQTGDRTLVNGYGPTEVTTFSHCHVMSSNVPGHAAIPIGGPIPGTAAYVLDESREAVPLAVEGELFIAGTGLALGYLGNPALTAERFLPDPFATDGSRMYRTGDLVIQAEHGRLNYLGRIDTQVKIRGFRVELGEIETCLRATGSVMDACVIHLKSAAGASALHAFVVPASASVPVDETALMEQLRHALPDYMIPRGIVCLEALPLTINGKVDRRALAALVAATGDSGNDHDDALPVKDALERSLLDGLRQLLGQPQITANDNFFDVGGDSLSAMRFCAAVSEQHGVDVPLVTLFEVDSLQDLIAHVRTLKETGALRASSA